MAKLLSLLAASIAYDEGVDARRAGERWRVEIKPGENVLSDDDAKRLDADPNFQRHYEHGHMRWLDETPAPAPVPEPAAKPSKAAKAEMAKFVADFLASPEENQAAMLPTLTPEQAAAVEAAKNPAP